MFLSSKFIIGILLLVTINCFSVSAKGVFPGFELPEKHLRPAVGDTFLLRTTRLWEGPHLNREHHLLPDSTRVIIQGGENAFYKVRLVNAGEGWIYRTEFHPLLPPERASSDPIPDLFPAAADSQLVVPGNYLLQTFRLFRKPSPLASSQWLNVSDSVYFDGRRENGFYHLVPKNHEPGWIYHTEVRLRQSR
jgi:hypothetical protein